MKVIEQIITVDKVKTEIVSVGKKKFKRVSWKAIHHLVGDVERVEWRRFKTNHLTKKLEQDELEKIYQSKFPRRTSPDPDFGVFNMYSSGSTMLHEFVSVPEIMDDKERRRIERGIVDVSDGGTLKLAAVKYVKEQTGWGLRESKDLVDRFFERQKLLKIGRNVL